MIAAVGIAVSTKIAAASTLLFLLSMVPITLIMGADILNDALGWNL